MFNFMWGTKLAKFQEDIASFYQTFYTTSFEKEFWALKIKNILSRNLAIFLLKWCCPNNLIIRQWCLIDLFKNKPSHANKIFKMILRLSLEGLVWQEGVYYWWYTCQILDKWLEKFGDERIAYFRKELMDNFIKLSYCREDGRFCAIPFGDINNDTDAKMFPNGRPELQIEHEVKSIKIGNIDLRFDEELNIDQGLKELYWIQARPVGFNTHIPCKNSLVFIDKNYEPWIGEKKKLEDATPFKFYKWYGNKYYKNGKYFFWLEFKDTFYWRRILSLFIR